MKSSIQNGSFGDLGPMDALESIEAAFGITPEPSFSTYPSYTNRVFGIRADDGTEYISKFYRPGRWSIEAITEEHQFLNDLFKSDVPVVSPIPGLDGNSVQSLIIERDDGETIIPFALFPKRGGRGFDAETDEDWIRLGSLAGRVHSVGRTRQSTERIRIGPGLASTYLETLVSQNLVHPETMGDFIALCEEMTVTLETRLEGASISRIHGDCHRGNILSRPDEGLKLIDFDDMAMGPVVQDLWLLLPGRFEDCLKELNLILEGYEVFSPFDRSEFDLIEPLRFLRMLHFLAWQAAQRFDEGFTRNFPDWGTRSFWIREIEDFRRQAEAINGINA